MAVEIDEWKFSNIGTKALMKLMDAAEEETECNFYMYIGLYLLTLFGEILFNKEGESADGSEE